MKDHTINDNRLSLAILVVVLVCVQGFGQSQNESRTESDSGGISCPIYLVTIEVRLGQQSGASDLGRENFVLYDNGVVQDISFWTKLEGSATENKETSYAIGYHPPVSFDGKLHRIRVVVQNKANNKLRVQFSPTRYRATREVFGEARPLMSPDSFFDTYGDLDWEDEKARLDNFAIFLLNNPSFVGHIFVWAGKLSGRGEAQARALRSRKYLVDYRKVESNRVVWHDNGFAEEANTILQPMPRERPMLKFDSHVSPSEVRFLENCRRGLPVRRKRVRL